MDLSAVFFLLAVLVLIGMFLYAPFVAQSRRVDVRQEHELSSLMAERDRVINALLELDFDHSLGKVPVEDYPVQRAELLGKGAQVLRRLDALQPEAVPAPDAESRLEHAVAAQREDGSSDPAERTDDEIESLISARRRQHKEKSAGFCPRCGQAVLVSDRFCSACGKSLT